MMCCIHSSAFGQLTEDIESRSHKFLILKFTNPPEALSCGETQNVHCNRGPVGPFEEFITVFLLHGGAEVLNPDESVTSD